MRRSVDRLTEAATSSNVVEGVIADDWEGAGTPIARLGLPIGAIIVSVVRGRTVLVPTSDDHLEVGDAVVVLSRGGDEGKLRQKIGLPAADPDGSSGRP